MARQFILEEAVESGQQVREECEVGGDGELEGDLHLDTSGHSQHDSECESDEQVQTTSRRKYADKRYYKRCPVQNSYLMNLTDMCSSRPQSSNFKQPTHQQIAKNLSK